VLALVRMLVLALVAALGVASGAHAFSAKPALRTFSDSAREESGDLARNAAECVGKIGISVRRAHRSIPFNRFRYYDPEAGQYASQDPIGLAGGAALYAYVHDPLAWVDQFGLNAVCGPKNAQEMAEELSDRLGKNSVSFSTPTTRGHIDLRGKTHFDKATQTAIPTPHVQTKPIHVGPNGKTSLGKEVTRPATKQDVRIARKLAEKQGLL
jgi:hypothetical protein